MFSQAEEACEPVRWGFRDDLMKDYEQHASEELFKLSRGEQIIVLGIMQYIAGKPLSAAQVHLF